MSDITQNAILYMVFMLAVVFLVVISAVALEEDLGQPEVTEFNDNGLTEPLAFEETDEWEVVKREDNSVVIEGTVYRIGDVNLSVDSIERTGDDVLFDVQVEKTQKLQPVNIRSGLTREPVNAVYPPLFGGGYEFNATISNVGEDENIRVNYVEDEPSEDDEDSPQS